MDKMERMSQTVKDLTLGGGAVAVGIATTETLKGGPPSTDLSYVLPGAKSAIVFAVPFNQDVLESFLKKEDMGGLNIDKKQIAEYLKEQSPLTIVTQQVRRGIEDGSLRQDLPIEVFSATLWSQMLGVLIVLNNKADLYEIFNLKAEEILLTHLELVSFGGKPKS